MRKDHLDVAKGIGILLVMIGHGLETYLGDGAGGARGGGYSADLFAVWKFIYSFHMPLFFVLAGLATPTLAGVRPEKAVSGALCLIIIAGLLQCVFAPLRLMLPLAHDAVPASLAEALRAVVWPAVKLEGYAIVVIWFLPCLALVRLAVWLAAGGTRAAGLLVWATLGVMCVIEQAAGIGYFQLRSVIVAAGFFVLGQQGGRLGIERLPVRGCWIGAGLALLVTMLSFDANHGCSFSLALACPGPRYDGFAVLMVSGAFGFLPLFALTAVAGAASVVFAAIGLERARWLARIGRRTLDLLVVNGIVLVFVQPHLAPLAGALPPALLVAPLVLLQIGAASMLHPVLARFFAFCRTLAARPFAWLAQAPNGVPT